jgi:hypothetical protein
MNKTTNKPLTCECPAQKGLGTVVVPLYPTSLLTLRFKGSHRQYTLYLANWQLLAVAELHRSVLRPLK